MNSKSLQILNKNNLLIKSNYDLNLVQNRYYLTILYNMQRENNNYVCRVHSDTFKELAKNNNQRTIDGIEDVLDSLIKKLIKLQEVTLDKKNEKHYTCGIISSYKWDSQTDEYKISLDGMVYDLLINYYELNKGYTPLNLGVLVGLNNYYAQRFYELLRMESWKGKKINFTVEYLRETFEIGDKYKQYTDFRKRVILPSIKVLNETGKFNISYEEIRQGRKVISIDFIVEDLEPREYFNITDEKVLLTNEISTGSVENIDRKINQEVKDVYQVNTQYDLDIEIEMGLDKLDTSMLEKGFLLNFRRSFKCMNFEEEYIQDAYYQVVGIILEKDNIEKLGMRQWKIFKKIFNEIAQKNKQEDIENFLWELDSYFLEKHCK